MRDRLSAEQAMRIWKRLVWAPENNPAMFIPELLKRIDEDTDGRQAARHYLMGRLGFRGRKAKR